MISAHHETAEWGRMILDGGGEVRVLIRAAGLRQYAHYLIPASGLETMAAGDWAAWLRSHCLADTYAPPVVATRCYWDLPLRQHTWEVSLLLQANDEVTATCLVPTEFFRPLMAWRGIAKGEVVRYADASLLPDDVLRTRQGHVDWDGPGDAMLVRLIDLLLSLRAGEAAEVELEVIADESAPNRALAISISSDGGSDWPTWEIRHLLAHLYEWTEHCQGVAWQWFSLGIRQAGKTIEVEMEAGYEPPPAAG